MERWFGRVAIVTGASAGIGAGIAQILVENGMKVVGVARRTDPIKEEDVKRIVKWTRENLGGVDVLVNNAGVALGCPLTDFDTKKFRKVWETNVLGLSLFTRDAIKDMKDRGVNDGHIFHISSVMGQRIINIEVLPNLGVYSATKHAVKVLTEFLRQELRDAKSEIKITVKLKFKFYHLF
ncbi:hypothetical protein B566_EDAN017935 [Ephemera danica]|nr:hypothetical protein B566_EDAN017935 [Ephemera danica]